MARWRPPLRCDGALDDRWARRSGGRLREPVVDARGRSASALMVIGVDNTILNVALPSIVRDLGASGSQLQLMVDAYTIVFACLLLTAGSLGGPLRARHALCSGCVWFGVFSAWRRRRRRPPSSSSPAGSWGSAARSSSRRRCPSSPTPSANPASAPPPSASGRGSPGSASPSARSPAACWSSGSAGARSFWSTSRSAPVALVLSLRFVPNTSDPAESPLDPVGAALSILGFLFFLYAIIEGPDGAGPRRWC